MRTRLLKSVFAIFIVLILIPSGLRAEDPTTVPAQPGDYGYLHHDYHNSGSVKDLQEKTGSTCCDGAGECRATYVDMIKGKTYIDGKWCDLPENKKLIRFDVILPATGLTVGLAMVCAGKTWIATSCPIVYCAALPENQ